MGSSGVWCPVPQAIEQYNSKIRREIERFFEHIKTDGSSFLIRLCMIGRKGERTNPTIMIFSADQETSKLFEASVRRSGILDRYPNFRLSSSTIPLEAPPIPLKSERRVRCLDSSTTNRSGLQTPSHGKRDIAGPRIGRKLERVVTSEAGPRLQHTTGGLIVRIGDELYQITSFGSTGATKSCTAPHEVKECDMDSRSVPDDSGYEQEFTSEKSLLTKRRVRRERGPYCNKQQPLISTKPTLCEAICSPPPAYDGVIKASLVWETQKTSLIKPVATRSSDSSERGASHYTLVKLTELERDEACNVVLRGEDYLPRGVDVLEVAKVGSVAISILVVTSRGPVSGTVLPDMASLRLHGSTIFQTVHATILSERLGPGDCGSAVIDAVTGNCYGHIILAVEGQVVDYMVPISDTLADVVLKFGKLPSLELDRHADIKHSNTIARWKCVNMRWDTNSLPFTPLGTCRSCSTGRLYSTRRRAAAHLRRKHLAAETTCKDENQELEENCTSLNAAELNKWTRGIRVTPLYAQVMQADSDSDSDYENDVYETDDESRREPAPSSLDYNTTDRQARLEKENDDLRRYNAKLNHEVQILEGDVDVLMDDRDELKQELEYLKRKLSERDAQLLEAQLDSMLHKGCVRPKDASGCVGS